MATHLGKGEAKGTPFEPRQGRSPDTCPPDRLPPFPNSSLDFALGQVMIKKDETAVYQIYKYVILYISSVVSISGSITSSSGNNANITFTDNATVSGGQIQLNCTYTATVSNGQMSGVWYYPGNPSPDGTITLNKTV